MSRRSENRQFFNRNVDVFSSIQRAWAHDLFSSRLQDKTLNVEFAMAELFQSTRAPEGIRSIFCGLLYDEGGVIKSCSAWRFSTQGWSECRAKESNCFSEGLNCPKLGLIQVHERYLFPNNTVRQISRNPQIPRAKLAALRPPNKAPKIPEVKASPPDRYRFLTGVLA